jgi:hypothetical protein
MGHNRYLSDRYLTVHFAIIFSSRNVWHKIVARKKEFMKGRKEETRRRMLTLWLQERMEIFCSMGGLPLHVSCGYKLYIVVVVTTSSYQINGDI